MEENKIIEKLNDTNYRQWCVRVKSIMVLKDCEQAIIGFDEPEEVKNKRKENIAKSIIILNINDQNLNLVDNCVTAKEMWETLEKTYTKFDNYHTILMLKDYVNLSKQENQSMDDYINKRNELYKKVEHAGHEFKQITQIGLILAGLPKSYAGISRSIMDNPELTLVEAKNRLKEEERRIKEYERKEVNESVAYSARNQAKPAQRTGPPKCYRCNKFGHIGKFCKTKKYEPKYNTEPLPRKSLWTKVEVVNDTALCTVTDIKQNKKSTDEWVIDSGATNHMTNDKQKFKEMVSCKYNVVNASGGKMTCEGRGNVDLNLDKECGGQKVTLKDVLYVPELSGNLVSVNEINKKGIAVTFEKNEVKIRNKEVNIVGMNKGGLYTIAGQVGTPIACSAVSEDKLKRWHTRFGHQNLNSLEKTLKSYNEEVPAIKADITKCDICNVGKMKRLSYPKQTMNRSKNVLDIIHSDVMGPISPASLGGKRYVLTFTDDYSRYTFVYLMEEKSEVLKYFISFKKMVEKFQGKPIKCLRTDNGREYVNREFDQFLEAEGIIRQLTSPGSPQQNGVAERVNETLTGMTRCMLEESGLDKRFWAEAIMTANYIKNRRYTSSNEEHANKLPIELWSKRRISAKHLRTFGCRTWLHRRRYNQKLDPRSERCIFVGYDIKAKAYRLYNEETKSVIVGRNVVFDEKVFPAKTKIDEPKEKNKVEFGMKIDWEEDLGSSGENEQIDKPAEEEHNVEANEEESEEEEEQALAADDIECSSRGRPLKKPHYLKDYECNVVTSQNEKDTQEYVPKTIRQAVNSEEKEQWLEAIYDEFENLLDNETWELVPRTEHVNTIGSRWTFTKKRNDLGEVVKYKARLVALGNYQEKGRDYNETYAPVVQRKTMRIMIALSALKNWDIQHVDINGAYLNASLPDQVYMELPAGYNNYLEANGEKARDSREYVCKLRKSLYGLHQSGKLWNEVIDTYLLSTGLKRSVADSGVYYSTEKELIVTVYVDDIVVYGEPTEVAKFKKNISRKFRTKDLGKIKRILSINVERNEDGIILHQKDYINQILRGAKMENCKGVSTPLEPGTKLKKEEEDQTSNKLKSIYQKTIGELLYLAINTRPDICYAVTYLSQFSSNPNQEHWQAVKHLLRYLSSTVDKCLIYRREDKQLNIYTDADWGSDPTDRKSFSGHIYMIAGGAVGWMTRKQRCVALSTAEAEFIALNETVKECLWLRNFFNEIGIKDLTKMMKINIDNQSAIKIAENRMTSDRSKHMDMKVLNVREHLQDGTIKLKYIRSEENLADGLTKTISAQRLSRHSALLGIVDSGEVLIDSNAESPIECRGLRG